MDETVAGARIGWTFIPFLTLAGFLSGIYTDGFIWFLSIVWLRSNYWFESLASISLGLTLAAVLWFYRQIWSWKRVVALTAVTRLVGSRRLLGEIPEFLLDTIFLLALRSRHCSSRIAQSFATNAGLDYAVIGHVP